MHGPRMIPQTVLSNGSNVGGHGNLDRSSANNFKSSSSSRKSSNCVPEINIAVLGSLGVGKSALVVKYMTRRFIMEYDPFIEDVYSKSESLDGKEVIIKLMDTSDSEEKSAERYLKWASGFIVVFSITCRLSFDTAAVYLDAIARYQQETGKEFPVTLVGNKSDFERYRAVSKSTAAALASRFDCLYQETSAAEDFDSVVLVFRDTARDVLRSRDLGMSMQLLFISDDRLLATGSCLDLPRAGEGGGGGEEGGEGGGAGGHVSVGTKRRGSSTKSVKDVRREVKDVRREVKDEGKKTRNIVQTVQQELQNIHLTFDVRSKLSFRSLFGGASRVRTS